MPLGKVAFTTEASPEGADNWSLSDDRLGNLAFLKGLQKNPTDKAELSVVYLMVHVSLKDI